jgi:MFS family permease
MTVENSRTVAAGTFRALRHRNFRLYWTGQLVSLIGSWMQSVAQGWLMHRLTDSAFMLGLLAFIQFFPVLLFSLFAGVIVDRVDKRKLLIVTQAAMTLQAVVLAAIVSAGWAKPWMVLVLAGFYGMINTFDLPARQSFVIEMTGREDLANGIALNSAAFNAARIVGPAVGGLLLAGIGEAGCFWLNAVSFLAVIAGLAMMKLPAEAPRPLDMAAVRHNLAEGVRYAMRHHGIRDLLVLLAVCAGLGFQFNVLLPVYTRDVLHSGPRVYGGLLAAFGAGSLVAAFRMTAQLDRWALRRHLLTGLTLGGAGMAAFAWVHWLPGMAVAGALAGFGLILYVSSTNVLLQMTTEDDFRGRVMSLYTLMFVGTAPFGALLAGGIAERWGAPMATSVCAVLLLGGAIWVSRRLREIAARELAERARAEQEAEPVA